MSDDVCLRQQSLFVIPAIVSWLNYSFVSQVTFFANELVLAMQIFWCSKPYQGYYIVINVWIIKKSYLWSLISQDSISYQLIIW